MAKSYFTGELAACASRLLGARDHTGVDRVYWSASETCLLRHSHPNYAPLCFFGRGLVQSTYQSVTHSTGILFVEVA